jgi:hypothetical protein
MIAFVLSNFSWKLENAKVTSVQQCVPKPALSEVEGCPLWLSVFIGLCGGNSPSNVSSCGLQKFLSLPTRNSSFGHYDRHWNVFASPLEGFACLLTAQVQSSSNNGDRSLGELGIFLM